MSGQTTTFMESDQDGNLVDQFLADRYLAKREIGEGGNGRVLLVEKKGEGEFAFKLIPYSKDKDIPKDTLAEEFDSDRLMPIEDHGVCKVNGENFYYIAMKYMKNGDLKKRLEESENGKLPPELVLPWMIDVAGALTVMHEHKKKEGGQGFVHRDVKPANIFINDDGRAVLGDFGLAFNAKVQMTGFAGTPYFMAPELVEAGGKQIKMDTSLNWDVFSFGRTLDYLLTGSIIGTSDLINVFQDEYLALRVRRFIDTCSHQNPELRYQSGVEVLEEIKKVYDYFLRQEGNRSNPAKGSKWSGLVGDFSYRRERCLEKIGPNFRVMIVAYLATALMIVPMRTPIFDYVFLSDRHVVAAFHGFVGSIFWAFLIVGCMLFGMDIFGHKNISLQRFRVMIATFGGIGGFLGGILAAVPGAIVTTNESLEKLGWIQNRDLALQEKILQIIFDTHFFWAHPFIGFGTGLGCGLFLALTLPKLPYYPVGMGWRPGLRFLWKQRRFFPVLLCPFLGLVPLWFLIDLPDGLDTLAKRKELVLYKSLGESANHSMGALGMCFGVIVSMSNTYLLYYFRRSAKEDS